MYFELSPLSVWIALWIMNSNNRDKFLHDDDDNNDEDDAKALTIPQVFSKNSPAKNAPLDCINYFTYDLLFHLR